MDLRSKLALDLVQKMYECAKATTEDRLTDVRKAFTKLAANTELFDNRSVACYISLCEVLQDTATLTDHEQESTTVVVVVLVGLEVFCHFFNSL